MALLLAVVFLVVPGQTGFAIAFFLLGEPCSSTPLLAKDCRIFFRLTNGSFLVVEIAFETYASLFLFRKVLHTFFLTIK